MTDTPAISDRNLEATTHISLKREPACFAFLSARSAAAPMPIDSINLDLASADYFQGRASLWTTMELRSGVNGEGPNALLGFDETFLRPFTRALIEASTTRAAYRMTILPDLPESGRCRVVVHPKLEIPPGATEQQIAQLCWDQFEPIIRENPSPWLWMYKAWRFRPKNAERPYPFYAHSAPRFDALVAQAEAEVASR
jgi:hypothetical protein